MFKERFSKRPFTLKLLLILVCVGACPVVKAQDSMQEKVKALANAYVEAKVVNSVAIGVIDGDSEFTLGVGQFSETDDRVPNADTVYEIGSISKVFTGILLADAINRGLVKADQPAQEFLPDGIKMPIYPKKPDRNVTLLHLSTHVSALPRMPDNFAPADPANPYVDYTKENLYEYLNKLELSRKPGIAEEYSNLGAGLLGTILTQKQDTDYETLLNKRISGPLGMSSTSLKLSDDQKGRLAPGNNAALQPASNWDFDSLASAGGIRSTVNDMLKFAKANLGPDDSETGKSLELAFTQQRKAKGYGSLPMGFGWMINPTGTRWHNGGTGGYHSMMFVSREKNRALVVLCNTATSEVDALASEIMALLDGKEVKPRKFRETIKASKEVCARYIGKYKINDAISFDIAYANSEKDALTVQLTGQPAFPIYPESETLWFLKIVKAEIEFTVDADGKCTALTLNQNGLRQTAQKQ